MNTTTQTTEHVMTIRDSQGDIVAQIPITKENTKQILNLLDGVN